MSSSAESWQKDALKIIDDLRNELRINKELNRIKDEIIKVQDKKIGLLEEELKQTRGAATLIPQWLNPTLWRLP